MRLKSTRFGLAVLGILVGVGALVLLRNPIASLLPRPEGKTHLTVERVEFRREARPMNERWLRNSFPRLSHSNEEMLTVYMFLSPEGTSPSWWFDEAKAKNAAIILDNLAITDEHGKQKKFPGFVSEEGHTNSLEMPRYYCIATCYVPKNSSLKGYTLHAILDMVGVESVQFQVPIDNISTEPVDMTASVTTPGIKILGKGFSVT